jgi:hypothetical protein
MGILRRGDDGFVHLQLLLRVICLPDSSGRLSRTAVSRGTGQGPAKPGRTAANPCRGRRDAAPLAIRTRFPASERLFCLLAAARARDGAVSAGAHARLKHPATGEAEPLDHPPERADYRFTGVMGILGCTLQRGVFRRACGIGERLADLLPARAEAIRPAPGSSSARVPLHRSP